MKIRAIVEQLVAFIHHNFLVLLISAYCLAAVFPTFGLWLRSMNFGEVHWHSAGSVKISLSLLMLSFLLINAGLGVKTQELSGLRQRPLPIIFGFAGNMLVPIFLVFCLQGAMQCWHNNEEVQNLLVGLAVIIAMPIAGSSTAWSQNANGNLSLSLGLVLLSTLFSPLTTPLIMNVFGHMTAGDYSTNLHKIAMQGSDSFMLLSVVLPSIIGIVAGILLGAERLKTSRPYLKLANFVVLLLLNYSNASTALPQALGAHDWDFLALIYGTTALMCAAAFGTGWLIAKFLKADSSERASLMFGLGMNNNGTGLVLANSTLAMHPATLLPMIFYTLVQQVFAAVVDKKIFRNVS